MGLKPAWWMEASGYSHSFCRFRTATRGKIETCPAWSFFASSFRTKAFSLLVEECAPQAIVSASYLSVMLRGMLIGTPCFLMWMRIGAAGWEPTCRSFSSCGPRVSTHAWKKPTDRAQLDGYFAHLPRSGGVKMAASVALSKVGGVGRDKFF